MGLFQLPVMPLPKLTTPNAVELAAKAKSPPAAQALAKPGMTSSEYVHTLEQNKMHLDAVHALAHGMPHRESVWWACQSSQKVATKLNPEELAANKAAETWVKNPTEANKVAAAQAASKTDFKGPGGWSAQAAAWSHTPAAAGAPPTKAVAGAPAPGAAPNLTASAVAGAVLLAAGLQNRPAMTAPQKPNLQLPQVAAPKAVTPTAPVPSVPQPQVPPSLNQSKLTKILQPFLDLGKNIATGKNSWA